MIKVTIIVPIYNVERYLRKCLDSLVNQTLQEIEVILINDCSPDYCNLIMEEYRERYPDKIKCFYQPTNQKQGAARNVGIRNATGEYIMFVDSDDWVDVTICEKLYNSAKKNCADLVFCDHMIVDEKTRKKRYIMETIDAQAGILNDKKRKSLFNIVAYPFAKLISRKLIIENAIYFAEGIKYEDKVAVPFYTLYAKKLGKINEALYFYNQREESTVHAKNEIFQYDRMKASKLCFNEMKQRGFYEKFHEEIDMNFIKDYYLVMLYYCVDKFDNPPIDIMNQLREDKDKMFPNYMDNKYIKEVIEPYYLTIANCNDISSEKLVQEYSENPVRYRSNSYKSYYEKYKNKIVNLIDTLHYNNKSVAIWGAGPKGTDFLNVCDEENKLIDYVIDGDINKVGNILSTGHRISDFHVVKEEINTIIVINRYHFGEIYTKIKTSVGSHVIETINLDTYLVYDLK